MDSSFWVEEFNGYNSDKSLLGVSWKQGLGMLLFIKASKRKQYVNVVQVSSCSESEARRLANMGESYIWQWFNNIKKDPGMGVGTVAQGMLYEKISEIVQRIA